MMMCLSLTAWLHSLGPMPYWCFLLVLLVGVLMAGQLYRYWKTIYDLRSKNEFIESERQRSEALTRSLLAVKAELQASNQDLRAENQRLEHRIAEYAEVQRERDRLQQRIVELTSAGPRLHGVWNSSHTFWHISRNGAQPMMQIGGRINLASSNTHEVLHLLAGYIEGQRMDLVEPISIRPDVIEDEQVILRISPPINANESCSLTAEIVLEDHQNRFHNLPKHSFRPTELAPPWLSEDPADVAF